MPLTLTSKNLSYLIVKYPITIGKDKEKYVRLPIPLTPVTDISTKVTGLMETGLVQIDNIPTSQISNTLSQASIISEAEIVLKNNSTFTYQVKGTGDLQLTIVSAMKNKLDFVLDALMTYANNELLKLRFTYIGTRAFKTDLYLIARTKTAITSNTEYTFVFRQPERGIAFAQTKTKVNSTVKG